MKVSAASIASGTRVKVKDPMAVPEHSTWEDDGQRTSTPVKRRLQLQFFAGHKSVAGEVVYVSNESERDRLRQRGMCKVQIRDAAGSMIVITAPTEVLKRAS